MSILPVGMKVGMLDDTGIVIDCIGKVLIPTVRYGLMGIVGGRPIKVGGRRPVVLCGATDLTLSVVKGKTTGNDAC